MFVAVIKILCILANINFGEKSLIPYVNPNTGTQVEGQSNPGPEWPNGMLQPGPEIGKDEHDQHYDARRKTVWGFSQTRAHGSGWTVLHDLQVLPYVGERKGRPCCMADWQREVAEVGYYSLPFADCAVKTEITVSERVAHYRFTFDRRDKFGRILVDEQAGPVYCGAAPGSSRLESAESAVEKDGRTVNGHFRVLANKPAREVFYRMQFSRPADRVESLTDNGKPGSRRVFAFDLKYGATIELKVAMSGVDAAGAAKNFESDKLSFDECRARCRDEWEARLARATITGDDAAKKKWYTMLYQSLVQPTLISDVDGRVRLTDNEIRNPGVPIYTNFLDTWDTFRALHPFYTIYSPKLAAAFARSLLADAKLTGRIPSNTVWGRYRSVMNGENGLAVVLDAWEKELLPEWKGEDLFPIFCKTARWMYELDKPGWRKFGQQSTSAQLESCVACWCAARLAKLSGLAENPKAQFYARCADSWTNLYDSATGVMRARGKDTYWAEEKFDPFRQRAWPGQRKLWPYNEGGPMQWAWHVLGDPEKLIAMHGGKEKAVVDLDRMFKAPEKLPGQEIGYGCTGAVGQYYHGNEPTHHVPYYYTLCGRPDRAAEVIREICTRHYSATPTGICGDGDSGQMQAWYLMSAMGFYQVRPSGGEYVIGAPQVESATIHLENGKTFRMEAKNFSAANKCVKRVTFNGRELSDWKLSHTDIMSGGVLNFFDN